MDTLKYAYKPNVMTMALVLAFFGICAVVLGICALTNDQTLVLRGIRLNAGQATVFYWILTALSAALTLVGMLGVVKGMTSHKSLVLNATAISLPKSGLRDKIVTVAYNAVIQTTLREVSGQRLLTIEYVGGKVTIAQSLLPDAASFDTIAHALAERVRLAKDRAP